MRKIILLILALCFCSTSITAIGYYTDIAPYLIYGAHFSNNGTGVSDSLYIDANVTNCVHAPDFNGNINQAYSCGGSGYSLISTSAVPMIDAGCYSIWVNSTDLSSDQCILGYSDSGTAHYFDMICLTSTGNLRYDKYTGAPNYYESDGQGGTIQANKIYNIVVCYNYSDSRYNLYGAINNVSAFSDETGAQFVQDISPTSLRAGFSYIHGLVGIMDEPVIFSGNHDYMEVAEYFYKHYDNWGNNDCVSPTGLESYFTCNASEAGLGTSGEVYSCTAGDWVSILSCPSYRYCYNASSSVYTDVCSATPTTTTTTGTGTTTTTTIGGGTTTTTIIHTPIIVNQLNVSSSLVDVSNATNAIDTSDNSKARGLLPDIYFGVVAFMKAVFIPAIIILLAVMFAMFMFMVLDRVRNA